MYEADVTESLDMKWYEAYQREAALRGPGESEEEEDYSESASASEESSETAVSTEWVSESGEESVESMEEEPAAEPPQPAQHQHHDRVAECQAFCRNAVFDAQLTTHEMANMHCAVEDYAQARARFLAHPFHYTDERWLERNVHPAPERAASGDGEQRAKRVFTIHMAPSGGGGGGGVGKNRCLSVLHFNVENRVHVTYFVNLHTGKLCTFNLVALATRLAHYNVEFSCKKFAKVNLRYLHALSHLLYTSSVLVETGSDNQATSRHYLQHTMRALREECGYPSINICERVCQNIVLTGHVNYHICMLLLGDVFRDAIKKPHFTGLIIRLVDLERFWANRLGEDGAAAGEEVERYARNYEDDDDDTEFVAAINARGGGCAQPQDNNVTTEEIAGALKETEEFATLRTDKPLKGTFLVFREGQIICTGLKRVWHAVKAFLLLFRLLELCKGTVAENERRERALAAAQAQR